MFKNQIRLMFQFYSDIDGYILTCMSKQERMKNLHLMMTFPVKSGHTSNYCVFVV